MIEAPALHLPFDKLETDVPWVPERHLEINPPEEVVLLEAWGPDAAGPTALSPVAITGPFRALTEWSRFQALVTAHRLEHFAATQTDFSRPLPELQAELRRSPPRWPRRRTHSTAKRRAP